ncbi:MAG: TIGR02281 family clan AA aspartic protease [Novosphingobium sp.]|nr:TIGR02281 family clan AA aspartic protease [Novosphingobium sp.]MCP5402774.1 TIGR02281 family clan AA aspartic protease [Novosphingobium sp.]
MSFRELLEYLGSQPLLALAVVAIFVTTMGGKVRRSVPRLGRFMQGAGQLGLVAALLLTIVQVARFTTGNELAMPQLGMPKQQVEGLETRIPISGNGHFWLQAQVNGEPRHFLIDTGATLTAISEETAVAARVPQKSVRQTMNMRTANGTIRAELVTIDELRFGNIVARDLDAVIAPGLEDTNVIGMNLLSRLASWRVEGQTLILVPRPPQRVQPES